MPSSQFIVSFYALNTFNLTFNLKPKTIKLDFFGSEPTTFDHDSLFVQGFFIYALWLFFQANKNARKRKTNKLRKDRRIGG